MGDRQGLLMARVAHGAKASPLGVKQPVIAMGRSCAALTTVILTGRRGVGCLLGSQATVRTEEARSEFAVDDVCPLFPSRLCACSALFERGG